MKFRTKSLPVYIATKDLQMHWVLVLKDGNRGFILGWFWDNTRWGSGSLKQFKQQVIFSSKLLPISSSCRSAPHSRWGVGQLQSHTESHRALRT